MLQPTHTQLMRVDWCNSRAREQRATQPPGHGHLVTSSTQDYDTGKEQQRARNTRLTLRDAGKRKAKAPGGWTHDKPGSTSGFTC